MYLQKKGICEEVPVKAEFEKIAKDLLMISITFPMESGVIPRYWRLTRVQNIPPLEIGVNCENQSLACIVFFIDSTRIGRFTVIRKNLRRGNILVDTDIFHKTNDYVNIAADYIVGIKNNTCMCFFEGGNYVVQPYRTDRLEVYSDDLNNIVGFGICDLSLKERSMLISMSVSE